MATKKHEEILDWYGNPIPGDDAGICQNNSRLFFMGEVEPDGTKYIRAYTSGGVPGDRIALEDVYFRIEDEETGKVLYDSRLEPPPDAKLLPGYIGYKREKQLKRYFPS